MHMADALLAPAVAATMYVASASAAGVSIHQLKKDDEPQKLPVMAVTSASIKDLIRSSSSCSSM